MKFSDDRPKQRMERMIRASKPMRLFTEYYSRGSKAEDRITTLVGMALAVAAELARPMDEVQPHKAIEVQCAEDLAWLDADLRNRKRMEKVIQLMLRYGPDEIVNRIHTSIGRASLERMLK